MELQTRILRKGQSVEELPAKIIQIADQTQTSPQPLTLIDLPLELGSDTATVEFDFKARDVANPRHPPALFGLRLSAPVLPPLEQFLGEAPNKEKTIELDNGVLTITGSSGHDTVEIWVRDSVIDISACWNVKTPYKRDGTAVTHQLGKNTVKRIECHVLKGNDLVSLEGDGVFMRAYGGPGEDWLRTTHSGWGHFLYGEEGKDSLIGGRGNDCLFGGSEADFLEGQDGSDVLDGGGGNDEMYGGRGSDSLIGGADDDVMHGGTHPGNTLVGGSGGSLPKWWMVPKTKDTLLGDGGNDKLYADDTHSECFMSGGPGDDELYIMDRFGTLHGDDGNDKLYGRSRGGIIGHEIKHGSLFHDKMYGGKGDDYLYGHRGNDRLEGGPGKDRIVGGGDKDTLLGGTEDDILIGDDGFDYADAVFNRKFDGSTFPQIQNTYPGSDEIHGNEGDDVIFGEAGSDTLVGGPGNDTMVGGIGFDTMVGDHKSLKNLSASGGDDVLWGGSGNDKMYGQGGHDYLRGGPDDDILYGDHIEWSDAVGHDFLDGGDGDDVLGGGRGDDHLYGGRGWDSLYGHAGKDILLNGWTKFGKYDGGSDADIYCIIGNPATEKPDLSKKSDVDAGTKTFNASEGDQRVYNTQMYFLTKYFNWVQDYLESKLNQ